MGNNVLIQNKRAGFEFLFIDKYIAGIQLLGSEIKSIRQGKATITDSFCFFRLGELFVKNIHISEYKQGGKFNNHNPTRDRKLLLQAKELKKIQDKLKDKGLTVIPIKLFINDKGLAKLEIAIAKGKKLHDKRDAIKKRETERAIKRIIR